MPDKIYTYVDPKTGTRSFSFEPPAGQSYGRILTEAEAAAARVLAAKEEQQKRLNDAFEKDLANQRAVREAAEKSCTENMPEVSEDVSDDPEVQRLQSQLNNAQDTEAIEAEGLQDKLQAVKIMRQFGTRVTAVLSFFTRGAANVAVSAAGFVGKDTAEVLKDVSLQSAVKGTELADEAFWDAENLTRVEQLAADTAPLFKAIDVLGNAKDFITGGDALTTNLDNLEQLSEKLGEYQQNLAERLAGSPDNKELANDVKRIEAQRKKIETLVEALSDAQSEARSRAFFRALKQTRDKEEACVKAIEAKVLPEPWANMNVLTE